MGRVLVVLAALVFAGSVPAAGAPVTVLPKPRFNSPAHEPKPGRVRGSTLTVDTYDHRLTVRLLGA